MLASEEEETFLANFVSDVLTYISSRCVCVCVCVVSSLSLSTGPGSGSLEQ